MPARNHIEVIARTFRVLESLADGPAELGRIAESSGLGKSSVFRILYTLRELGYVEQAGVTAPYRLSLKMAALARRTGADLTLAAAARPQLIRLRDELGESAWLAELRSAGVVLTEAAQAHHKLRLSLDLGDACPLHASAVGKAVAAHLPPGELKRLLGDGRLPRYTARTIVTRTALQAELAKVRRRGFALNQEETIEGAFLAGAPVFDAAGRVCAAVSVSAPTARCLPAKRGAMIAAVRRAAAEISRELERAGFQAPYRAPGR
jgi:IclR family acetate operon transcriptional repressor